MKGSTAMWNYDAVDKKEAERMASLYGEDATRTVEHGTDAEYFDEDFRMRATEGINLWTVAKEIIEAVPAAKPAEEEPAQARGPKH